MEIFLNFVWVLLFFPAGWMWQRGRRRSGPALCFLTLACVLVLLFPVISATDDLHAAPQAMEESSSTKRSLKHADVGKTQSHIPSPPALVTPIPANAVLHQSYACIPNISSSFPQGHVSSIVGDRAPPSQSLTYTS